MLEAKSQLSKLVKAALESEDVVGLGGRGKLKRFAAAVDAAFTAEVEAEVAREIEGRR